MRTAPLIIWAVAPSKAAAIPTISPRGLYRLYRIQSAVIALTKAIAVDHGAEGIRANCVAPGPVYTPMVYSRGMTEQALRRAVRRRCSSRRVSAGILGGAVRFPLPDQARYITGQGPGG